MWIPLPRSHSAAWRIQQHAVELGFRRQLRSPLPDQRAVVERLRPRGTEFEALQTPRSPVTRPYQAAVLHEIGEVQHLATLAGAGVPPSLARLRIAEPADRLRTDILHFKVTGLKLRRTEQIFPSAIL